MALNGLFCADVPLRNYSLTHVGQLTDVVVVFYDSSVLLLVLQIKYIFYSN